MGLHILEQGKEKVIRKLEEILQLGLKKRMCLGLVWF